MADMEYSENSACTWNLGVCIDDPEDVYEFERRLANPVLTPEMKEMIDQLKDFPELYE